GQVDHDAAGVAGRRDPIELIAPGASALSGGEAGEAVLNVLQRVAGGAGSGSVAAGIGPGVLALCLEDSEIRLRTHEQRVGVGEREAAGHGGGTAGGPRRQLKSPGLLRSGGIGDGDREVLHHARHIGQAARKRDADAALVLWVIGGSGVATAGNARRAFSGHAAVTGIRAVFVGPQQNRDGRPRDSQLDHQKPSLALHIFPLSKHRRGAILSMAMGVLRNYHTVYTIPARWSALRAVVLKGIVANCAIENQRKPSRSGMPAVALRTSSV